MLRCKEVAERASALIDGELGLFDAIQVRLHLAMCKGCNAFIRQMRQTRALAKAAALVEDPPAQDAEARIAAILAEVQAKGRPAP
jgi:anti-sigma factor RsiW